MGTRLLAVLLVSLFLLAPVVPAWNTGSSSSLSFSPAIARAQNSQGQSIATDNPFSCGIWAESSLTGCIGHLVYYLFYVPTAFFLAGSGIVLNIMIGFSLDVNVLNANFVSSAWSVMRDLANMLFIFALVFIAIATILQLDNYSAKRLLPMLIAVALLMNFSLFVARVVIDLGNTTAGLFYDAIDAPNVEYAQRNGVPQTARDITAGLVAGYNPQQILFGNQSDPDSLWRALGQNSPGLVIFLFFMATILNIVGTFTFLSVALLFIARVAVLWFLMALAPLAFVAMILPGTRSWTQKWWSGLIGNSFSVAIFLFFLWFTLVMLQNQFLAQYFGNPTFGVNDPDGVRAIKSMVMIALQFGLIIVMLQYGKKAAIKMSGAAAAAGLSFGNKLAGGAVGLLAGGVGGFAARRLVGGTAARLAESSALREKAAQSGFGGWAARQRLRGYEGLSKQSFDIRSSKTAGSLTGGTITAFGQKAQGKGGYREIEKRRVERRENVGKLVGENTLNEQEAIQSAKDTHAKNMEGFDRKMEAAKARGNQERVDYLNNLKAGGEAAIRKAEAAGGAARKKTYAETLATEGSMTPLAMLRRYHNRQMEAEGGTNYVRAASREDRKAALKLREKKDALKSVKKALQDEGVITKDQAEGAGAEAPKTGEQKQEPKPGEEAKTQT